MPFFPCSTLFLAALVASGFPLYSNAAVLLTFDNGTPSPSSITTNAGDSFSFDVILTSTAEETLGLTYFLSESTVGNPGNPGSGMFVITGRSVAGTPFSDLQTTNITFLQPANASLDPQNEKDAGGLERTSPPSRRGSILWPN